MNAPLRTPKVTVLMAVHNGLPYLRECIESVLGQEFADFEFMILDDASTDGSAEVARSYGDPRVRVLHNSQNIGQAPALNKGLAVASGEYVARIDADDRWTPQRLSEQVKILDAEPAVAVVGSWVQVIDRQGRPGTVIKVQMSSYAGFLFALFGDNPLGHPAVTYRRELVRELGGYDASLAPAEDYDLWVRIALAGHGARIIPKPLTLYRRHEGQLSVTMAQTQDAHAVHIREKLIGLFADASHVRQLGLFFQTDPRFWTDAGSVHEQRRFVRALGRMLKNVRSAPQMSGEDRPRMAYLFHHHALHVADRIPDGVAPEAGAPLRAFAKKGLPGDPWRVRLRSALSPIKRWFVRHWKATGTPL